MSALARSHPFGIQSIDSFLFLGSGAPDEGVARGAPAPVGPGDIAFVDGFGLAKPSGTPGNGNGGGGGGSDDGGTSDGSLLTAYTSGGNAKQQYNIDISFSGTWTAALQKAFIDASELISDIITTDIRDVVVPGFGKVDDIVIEASLVEIDGSGGVLGRAGPTSYRTNGFLPATAIMEFDVADAADYDAISMFNDIVFHEMAHSIGFGTMWGSGFMNLVDDSDGNDLRFTGSQATAEYQAYLAATGGNDPNAGNGVPVESDFGPGTRGGHWNEGSSTDDQFGLDNEIMTGFIDTTDDGNHLSDITIAALDDMGYETVYAPGTDVASMLNLAIFEDHLVA